MILWVMLHGGEDCDLMGYVTWCCRLRFYGLCYMVLKTAILWVMLHGGEDCDLMGYVTWW